MRERERENKKRNGKKVHTVGPAGYYSPLPNLCSFCWSSSGMTDARGNVSMAKQGATSSQICEVKNVFFNKYLKSM